MSLIHTQPIESAVITLIQTEGPWAHVRCEFSDGSNVIIETRCNDDIVNDAYWEYQQTHREVREGKMVVLPGIVSATIM